MRFSKLEGLGNDFIVVSSEAYAESQYPDLTRKLCNRHFGVGADGLILFTPIVPPTDSHFNMRIFNADGGEAELSGNGLRCLAAYLFRQGLHYNNPLRILTRAGVKEIRRTSSTPPEFFFEVDMGNPILDRHQIPLNRDTELTSLVGHKLVVAGEVLTVTISSMGNPHGSIFVDNFESTDWERLGSQIENHPLFPDRTNVEFIKVRSRRKIEVRFWERGVGKTNASGTGSCAATVASVLNGQTDREVQVETLGGNLEVVWKADNSLCLKGPAKFICDGEYYGV